MKRSSAARAIAACLLGTCLPLRGRAATATLNIAEEPSDGGMEVSYAQSHGFPEQFGITLTISRMANGAVVLPAVTGGTFDIGQINSISLLRAWQRGVGITCLAEGGVYSGREPTYMAIVSKDSPVTGPRDLKGKIFGVVGLGSLADLGVRAWIDRNGGDSQMVRFVELPFIAMAGALAAGRIDAGLITEPEATIVRDQVRVIGTPYDAVAPSFASSVWVASTAWAAANMDLARRFASMIYRAAPWINANHAATSLVLKQVTTLDADVIRRMHRQRFASHGDPSLLQPVIDIATRYRIVTKPVTIGDLVMPQLRDL